MHVLTKIFIVLVTLLAILLVPLVVVSAKNQEYWKTQALDTSHSHRLVSSQLQEERLRSQNEQARLNQDLQAYSQRIASLQSSFADCERNVIDIKSELMTAQLALSENSATSLTLHKSLKTNSDLNRVLVDDVHTLRTRIVSIEAKNLDLEKAILNEKSLYKVAKEARRKLEEELKQLRDEQTSDKHRISEYVARYGELEDGGLAMDEGLAPDRNLQTTILDISREGDHVLAEIDAGSRDGVKEGWILTVGDKGTFIGKIRVIDVDINRSTGILSLEDNERGLAQVGHRAYALMGQN